MSKVIDIRSRPDQISVAEQLKTRPLPPDQLLLGRDLDGSHGANRYRGRSDIVADDDLGAIETWVALKTSEKTKIAYRREAHRLVLWALVARNKPLSSLIADDLMAYRRFIANPTPEKYWCGPNQKRKGSGEWRPFVGPLSKASSAQVMRVLKGMFEWMVGSFYLERNPLAIFKDSGSDPNDERQAEEIDRVLTPQLVDVVFAYIDSMPQSTKRERAYFERARYLIEFLLLLGPRVSEMAGNSMGDIKIKRGAWWWKVTGKGKTAEIPVPNQAMAALKRYRIHLGIEPFPSPGERTSMVLSVSGRKGIGENMIYRCVKGIFDRAAQTIDETDPLGAKTLRLASTHWMRHTAITRQVELGIPLLYVQKSARHAKRETTERYLHAHNDQWAEAMENIPGRDEEKR